MTIKMFGGAALVVGVLMSTTALVPPAGAQDAGAPQAGTPPAGTSQPPASLVPESRNQAAQPDAGPAAAPQAPATQAPATQAPATQAGEQRMAPRAGQAGPPPRRSQARRVDANSLATTSRPPSSRPESSRPASSRPASRLQAPQVTPAHVLQAQQTLNERGFDSGEVDGILGPKTAAALQQFQQAEQLPQSGELDRRTAQALGIELPEPEPERQQVIRQFDRDPYEAQFRRPVQSSRPDPGILSSDPNRGIESSQPYASRTPQIADRPDSGARNQVGQPLGRPIGQDFGGGGYNSGAFDTGAYGAPGPQSRPYRDPLDRNRDPYDTMIRPLSTPWR